MSDVRAGGLITSEDFGMDADVENRGGSAHGCYAPADQKCGWLRGEGWDASPFRNGNEDEGEQTGDRDTRYVRITICRSIEIAASRSHAIGQQTRNNEGPYSPMD